MVFQKLLSDLVDAIKYLFIIMNVRPIMGNSSEFETTKIYGHNLKWINCLHPIFTDLGYTLLYDKNCSHSGSKFFPVRVPSRGLGAIKLSFKPLQCMFFNYAKFTLFFATNKCTVDPHYLDFGYLE